MNVKVKIILGIVGVVALLVILILVQGGLGEFLSTRAPIEQLSPEEIQEYTAICEQSCVDFAGSEKQECVQNCLEFGEDYF